MYQHACRTCRAIVPLAVNSVTSGSLSSQEINKDVKETDEFSMLAFDSASVTDLLKEFSQTSITRIALGYVLMVNIIHFSHRLKR